MDEYLVLLALSGGGTSEQPNKAMEISDDLKDFIQTYVSVAPTFATLRHSGMQAINHAIAIAKKQIAQFKKKKVIALKVDACAYFEIGESLYLTKIPQDTGHGGDIFVLPLDNDGVECPFDDSVDPVVAIRTFFPELLDSQCKESKKIILIDHTLSCFDGRHLNQLLSNFADAISNGRLCFLVVHSLNKHFGVGLDKTPVGLLYGFYNKDSFPWVHQVIESELASNQLGSMPVTDPSVLLVHQMVNHTREAIQTFPLLIKNRTQEIFEDCICDALKTPESIISFVKRDLLIAIFVNMKKLASLSYAMYGALNDLMFASCIQEREGFGFNHSSYTLIHNEDMLVHRVSIGTESLDEVKHFFDALNSFCIQAAILFEKYGTNQGNRFLIALGTLKRNTGQQLPERDAIKESVKLVQENGKLLSLLSDALKKNERIVRAATEQNSGNVPKPLKLEKTARFSIWSLADVKQQHQDCPQERIVCV